MSDLSRSQTVLLVDAMGLYLRHFVAHPAMGKDGQHVGGIVGFLIDLKRIVEKFRPNPIYVIWEGGGSTRRRAIFKDYKSHRRPERLNRFYEDDIPNTTADRDNQIKVLVRLLKLTPICQVYVPDCEADDVIGYMSRYHWKDALKIILSADKDYYQLISDGSIIYSPTWKKLVQESDVIERFGVHPVNFSLAKSVCGDSSDNIPGVDGVGFKTLAKRFPQLREDKEVTVAQLVEESKRLVSEGSKVQAIRSISENEVLIQRNWSLVNLDTANLAAYQIDRINHVCDTFKPSRNKIEFMRILIQQGIQTFNVDQFFLTLSHIQTK
jgi:5'-3' exonuclease